MAAIEQARRHIHIETYIFADDEVGQRFSDALLAKHKQGVGVGVRIIYDAVGSIGNDPKFFEHLPNAGVAAVAFRPLKPSTTGASTIATTS